MKKIILIVLPVFMSAEFMFNGFGTLNLSSIDSSNVNHHFLIDQKQTINNGIDFYSGSLFGLQGTFTDEYFTIMGQIISRKNVNNDFNKPHLDWLFIKTDITDNLEFSVGRLRIPLYIYSKTIYVDYTRDFSKLPVEIYGAIPFSYYDGIEIKYSTELFNSIFTVIVGYSKVGSEHSFRQAGTEEYFLDMIVEDIKIISLFLENGNFLIRGSYATSTSSLILEKEHLDYLFLLSQFGLNEFKEIAEMQNDKGDVYALGFEYYLEDFIVSGEWLSRITESIVPDITAYYFSISYNNINYEKWTPFITYANLYQIQKINTFLENCSNSFVKSEMESYYNSFGGYNGQNNNQSSYSIGVRYMFNDNINLKTEIKRQSLNGIADKDKNIIDEEFMLYQLSLDFVF